MYNLKICGPINDVTGYGELTRQIVLALDHLPNNLSIKSQNWACTKIINSKNMEMKIARLMKNTCINNCSLFINVPTFFRTEKHVRTLGLTMSEVSGIPEYWVKYCNKVNTLLIPSSFNLTTFADSGVIKEKLRLTPLGVNQELYSPIGDKFPLKKAKDTFIFLSVGEWNPRKGFDILLRAYVKEFKNNEDVLLVIRSHRNGSDYDPTGQKIMKEIESIIEQGKIKDHPPILLLPQTLPAQVMPSLYRACHCFVQPTRGEGWNMPVYEALACGIPVITTRWSAHLDYLTDENSYLINVKEFEPVPLFHNPLDKIYNGFCWALPDIEHLQYLMRCIFENYDKAQKKAQQGLLLVKNNLSWHKCANRIHNYILETLYLNK